MTTEQMYFPARSKGGQAKNNSYPFGLLISEFSPECVSSSAGRAIPSQSILPESAFMHLPRACFCLIADFPLQGSTFTSVCGRLSNSLPSADRPGQVMLLPFLPPSDWIERRSTIQLILPDLFKWKNHWYPSHIAEDLLVPSAFCFHTSVLTHFRFGMSITLI